MRGALSKNARRTLQECCAVTPSGRRGRGRHWLRSTIRAARIGVASFSVLVRRPPLWRPPTNSPRWPNLIGRATTRRLVPRSKVRPPHSRPAPCPDFARRETAGLDLSPSSARRQLGGRLVPPPG